MRDQIINNMTSQKSVDNTPCNDDIEYNELLKKIGGMFASLQKMLKDNLPLIENEANRLIEQKETNSRKIMWQLDYLLDYTMHGVGEDVFFKLVEYLRTIDEEAAQDYMEIYREQGED